MDKEKQYNAREDIIAGRKPVIDALSDGSEIDCIFIAKGNRTGSINTAISLAKQRGIVVKEVSPIKLSAIAGSENHQGIVAQAAFTNYKTVDDILYAAKESGLPPFIVVLDGIEDPHNLGAVIRTAAAAGVNGVIIPKRRSAGVNATVYKTSAGACRLVPIAKVPNIAAVLDDLKANGLFVYAADSSGTHYKKVDYGGGIVLVIGAEGSGIGRLVKEKSDFLVSLPMERGLNSLNASVSAGILMYEIMCDRRGC